SRPSSGRGTSTGAQLECPPKDRPQSTGHGRSADPARSHRPRRRGAQPLPLGGFPMQSMFVNGRSTVGHASGAIEVRDPATEEPIESVPRGTASDVEDAVAAARAAFPAWRSQVANERALLLHEVARGLRAHQERLVELLCREQGKPWSENEEELV